MNEDSVEKYLKYIKTVQGYSDKTVISYRHDLQRLLLFLSVRKMNLSDMVYEDSRLFVQQLFNEKLSASTINRIQSSCRSFFHWFCIENNSCVQPFERIKSLKNRRKIPTVLSKSELEKLLDFEPEDYTQLCEKALFNTFYSTGCRLSEVLDMKTGDIDFENRRILVTGKGSKQRFVFLTKKAKNVLTMYLSARNDILKDKSEADFETVFINKKGKRLPVSTVHSIFDKYRERLNLTKKFTPHVFRHTFATDLLDADSDIRVVQELLGHENIGTTQIYTHVTGSRIEQVYRNAHPHGRKK